MIRLFQVYLATNSIGQVCQCCPRITADSNDKKISIYEIYKIVEEDPVLIRIVAEVQEDGSLEFVAPKLQNRRRRNFYGRNVRTAVTRREYFGQKFDKTTGLNGNSECHAWVPNQM